MSRFIQSLLYPQILPWRGTVHGWDGRLMPSPTVLESGSSTADGTSVATASIAPAGNQLLLACIAHRGTVTPVPTAVGNGLTWVLVQTMMAGTRRLTVLRAAGAAPSDGAITFDFGADSQTSFVWDVIQFSFADTTGTHGSGAVVQAPAGTTTSGGTSLAAPTLAALEHPQNVNLSVFVTAANEEIGNDANFAELSDDGVATNTNRLETQWARNRTDCTATFSATVAGALSIEVKAG